MSCVREQPQQQLEKEDSDRLRQTPLTHTLVPLVVLHVTLRAAAAVASQHVLAAVLTAVVAAALVHI